MDLLNNQLLKKLFPQGLVAKKVRRLSSSSKSLPLENAPAWAVWTTKSKFFHFNLCELTIYFY